MIKEIVGKIIEAENRAEELELRAREEAAALLANAQSEAARLRQNPEAELKPQVEAILAEAEAKAEKLAKEKLEAAKVRPVDAKLIEKTAAFIAEQYLREV